MKERRTKKYMLALSPSERDALELLSEREGSSGADVVRRLVLEEARRLQVLPVVIARPASIPRVGDAAR